jgi:hypothetical protein
MGKQLKDLSSISLPVQANDKILIERANKGYSANLSEILSSIDVDVTGYVTSSEVQTMIDAAITTVLNTDV